MPSLHVLSPYQKHQRRWQNCQECELWHTRKTVVLGRGTIPCAIVLVGEAPGRSEDILGSPFVGPAGYLMDQIIERSIGVENEVRRQDGRAEITYSLTNLIACIPLDEDRKKTTEPPIESVEACTPRLQEFMEIADPKLIITVGNAARDWLSEGYRNSISFHRNIPQIEIVHPAWILRDNLSTRDLKVKRCVVTIADAIENL